MITVNYDKKYREGFSWKVILAYSTIFPLVICLLIESILMVSAMINGSDILGPIVTTSILFLFFFPFIFLFMLLRTLIDQKVYLFYNDHITIMTSGIMPIFGRAFFIEDIKIIDGSDKIPLFYLFDRKLNKHKSNITLPFYMNDVYIIELRPGFKVKLHGNTVPRPTPRNFLERLFYRGWYDEYVIVPKHIIKKYIDLGYYFPTQLLGDLGKR